ncbi:MAG: LysE family translocator [Bacteroidota bacterium]
MSLLLEGIGWGIFLSILVGPILFILIQTALERGARAGLMVGLGIWISDIFFVISAYLGIAYVLKVNELDGFRLWLGCIGGVVLVAVGLSTMLLKPPAPEDSKIKLASSYLALFTKGFLINTLNPFTFFFWLTITGAVIAERKLGKADSFLFYSGILGTIIFTDSLKIVLAKAIRKKLKPHYILWVRRIAGAALVVFGIVLILRVTIWG